MSRTWGSGPCRGRIDARIGSAAGGTGPGPPAELADFQAEVVFDFGPVGSLKEKHPAAAAAGGSKKGRGTTMRIERRHTTAGHSPYAAVDFGLPTSESRNPDGSLGYRLHNVAVPAVSSHAASDA